MKAIQENSGKVPRSLLIADTAILLGSVYGAFYFLGLVAWSAYLEVFTLTRGMFPLDAQNTVLWGFLTLIRRPLLVTAFLLVFLSLVLMLIITTMYWLDQAGILAKVYKKKVPQSSASKEQNTQNKKSHTPSWFKSLIDWLDDRLAPFLRLSLKLLSLMALLLLLAILSWLEGEWSAKEQAKDMNKVFAGTTTERNYKVVTVSYKGAPDGYTNRIEGIVLDVPSQQYCPVYMRDSTVIIPKERIISLTVYESFGNHKPDTTAAN